MVKTLMILYKKLRLKNSCEWIKNVILPYSKVFVREIHNMVNALNHVLFESCKANVLEDILVEEGICR